MKWLRWHAGTAADPKWTMIAARAKVEKVVVISVWAVLLEFALEQDDRGSVADFDTELCDCTLDVPDGTSAAVIQALNDKGLIKDERISAWEKRQFEEQRTSSAERVRRHREKNSTSNAPATERNADVADEKRDVTSCNGDVTPCNADVTECNAHVTVVKRPVTPPDTDTETETDTDTEADTETKTVLKQEGLLSTSPLTPSSPDGSSPPDGGCPPTQDNPLALTADGLQASKAPPPCPHKAIIELYHEILPIAPRVRVWEGVNKTHLQQRWRSAPERQSLDWWREFFTRVARSDFLMGRKAGKRGSAFRVSLGWLVKAEKFQNVLNGDYDNFAPPEPAQMSQEEIAAEFDRIDRVFGFKPRYDAEAEAEYVQEVALK